MLTTHEFIDGVALGQVTPGPVLITAKLIGCKVGGLAGAVTSTVAVFLLSFLVLVGIAPHFERLKRLRAVQTMIRGVQCSYLKAQGANMCEAVVYLDDREIMRDVVRVEPLPDGIRLTMLLEPPRVVPAVIREIDLLKHRVILEPLPESGAGS